MTDRTTHSTGPAGALTKLQEARLKRWHQAGEALLTYENVRSWLNAAGLVLYAPRPQINAPAPTMVEAVLGGSNASPTLEQTAEAKRLLARLVAEGIAVPLNLLGAPSGAVGETPDFVASAGVFAYVFTLRGDKLWKQAPSTSGSVKVSPLAANTYEVLTRLGPRTAYDLAPELGNAVTETAVLRALGELWTHLRVLPIPQPDGGATLWELATTRFTKQIKAGANAGQPSALSALISLYLGQAAVASEEEIETFLSPLAPRSRIRDVVHALTAARQLETIAIEGRTMVHVTGETPAFLAEEAAPREQIEVPVAQDAEGGEAGEAAAEAGEGPRIKKFVPKPRKVGTGYLAKGAPVRREGRPVAVEGRPKRDEGSFERERRPFQKKPREAEAAPRFDRPWEEDRGERPEGKPRPQRRDQEFAAGAAREGGFARGPKPERGGAGGWKPAFRSSRGEPRESFQRSRSGEARPQGGDAPPRRDFSKGPDTRGARPRSAEGFRREGSEGEAAPRQFRKFDAPRGKRPFTKREEGAGGERPRRQFRPQEGGGAERPRRQFRPEGGSEDRPRRTFRPQEGGSGERPRRTFRPQEGGSGERPRRTFRPQEGGGTDRPRREFKPRAGGDERPRREFKPRTGGDERPRRPFRSAEGAGEFRPKRPFRSGEGAPREFKPRSAGGSGFRKTGGFAGGKPRGRSEGGFKPRANRGDRPGGRPFVKKAPSGTRPPKRTFKPKEDESA